MAAKYGERWIPTGETLGAGGQGEVFWVTDGPGGERFVLKRLRNSRRIGRFKAEVEALRQIQSPHIPEIFDYSTDDPAYIVTAYHGRKLSDYIRAEHLTPDQKISILIDITKAVCDAHQAGVVHRDIKPDNIVVDDGDGYLIDFGICQFIEGEFFNTLVDEAFGARSFAAPELELGSDIEGGTPADIYSLGKLAYWIMSDGSFFPRENLNPAAIGRLIAETGVERPFVRRWIQATVVDSPQRRLTAEAFLQMLERDRPLIRQGFNAVGVSGQTCRTCGLGELERRTPEEVSRMGLRVEPVNIPAQDSMRILHCSHCGHLQIHLLSGTSGRQLWEI